MAGDQLHVVWWDDRDGNDEIYYKHSADAGETWTPDRRLTHSPDASHFPMVTAARGRVHVVWTEGKEGSAQVLYTRP